MPTGPLDEVWVHFGVEQESFCARFGDSAVKTNKAGHVIARNATVPNECPLQLCGNGTLELGEVATTAISSRTTAARAAAPPASAKP